MTFLRNGTCEKERVLLFILFNFFYWSIDATDTSSILNQKKLCRNVIGISIKRNSLDFVFDSSIVNLCCDTLPQVKFWEKILELSPDSAVLNVAHTRQFLQTVSIKDWNRQTEDYKYRYRDSIRRVYHLPDSTRILFTTGKGHYYVWDTIFYLIDKAIDVFVQYETDPWYAQSILLIESPKGNLKSPKGARGYFQLMPKVARKFGLKVNRHTDERLDIERSAYAAAMLIKTICIPETKRMLDSLQITYNEDDLWFKLLCMHVYHAGAYNVKNALMKSNCKVPGMEMIYCLWQTRTGAFQSASQNYSQLILTAYVKVYKALDLFKCYRPG